MAHKLKMSNPLEVRRAAARIANWVINGDIEPKQANAALYAASVSLNSIRTCEQQRKIDELEKLLEGLTGEKN